jgi:hypothetical protein
MPEPTWVTLIASSVGGGFIVKLIDYIHDEVRSRREKTLTARELLTKHHDPILKAADELVGRIRSLAISDFQDFRVSHADASTDGVDNVRRVAPIFYVVQFWSRIQLLKVETGSIAISAKPAGARLQKFIQHLESRDVRLVDRSWQRASGEAILVADDGAHRPMNLYEFCDRYRSDEPFRAWFAPLVFMLEATGKDKTRRQTILKYGVVLHALIDTLDPDHVVTTKRDPWPSKLSHTTRKELEYGSFAVHLAFVKDARRYVFGQKKRRPVRASRSSTK